MLLTMTLSESETLHWSGDARLRSEIKLLARKLAKGKGRRFWQVQASSGKLLAVGEAL